MFQSCRCSNLPLRISLAIGTCLTFLVCLSPLCYAANWYVDNAATGSNKGTSWANAWTNFSNIKWGIDGVKAGDTLFISGGSTSKTYTSSLTVGADGTPTARITIKVGQEAPHNGMVVFNGRNTSFTAIDFGGKSYVTISGDYQGLRHLKIMDCGATAINGDSLINDIVEYVEIKSCKDGIEMTSSSGTIIRYCYLQGIYHDHGIQVIGSTGGFDDILIHHNIIDLNTLTVDPWTGPDGIQATCGCSIYDNYIHTTSGTVTSDQHQDGVQLMGHHHKVYNNKFQDFVNACIELNLWGDPAGYIYCYNNEMSLTNSDVGVKRGIEIGMWDDQQEAITEVRFYNNTFVDFGFLAIIGNLRTASVSCPLSSYPTYPGGAPTSLETVCRSWYSDISIRTILFSLLNRNSARAFASSVFPTPVVPKKMKEPIGRFVSCNPARLRRIASETAPMASS